MLQGLLEKFSRARRPETPPETVSDPDRDAAAIVDNAERAAAAILARREALDREGREDAPLVVLAGEKHGVSAHIVYHMLILRRLLESGQKIAVGLERPYDFLPFMFFQTEKRRKDQSVAAEILRRDLSGEVALKTDLLCFNVRHAVHAGAAFTRFLLDRRIPSALLDVAETDSAIDVRDPFAAASLKRCFGFVAEGIRCRSLDGICVRNDHMMRKARIFARETGARILFQRGGAGHAAGYRDMEAEYSLSHRFRRAGIPFFALLPLCRDFSVSDLPPNHNLKKGDVLVAQGIPEDIFEWDGLAPVLEADYVNGLLERAGWKEEAMSVAELEMFKALCARTVKRTFAEWRSEFLPR